MPTAPPITRELKLLILVQTFATPPSAPLLRELRMLFCHRAIPRISLGFDTELFAYMLGTQCCVVPAHCLCGTIMSCGRLCGMDVVQSAAFFSTISALRQPSGFLISMVASTCNNLVLTSVFRPPHHGLLQRPLKKEKPGGSTNQLHAASKKTATD